MKFLNEPIDYERPDPHYMFRQVLFEEIGEAIGKVMVHGQFINGPEVGALEGRLSEYVGVKHALGCASGSDALLVALMAHGVGVGDIVAVPAFGFIATAMAVLRLGAIPVFVDIDPDTFNMNPSGLVRVLRSPITHEPGYLKGVITVDLFGLPTHYDKITDIANEYGLWVIEDAAQSFGATYHGFRAGSLAEIGCTSFFPTKPLGCFGDGGMIFTNDDALYDRMKSICHHGIAFHAHKHSKYTHMRTGINSRLDTIQAAILGVKMGVFEAQLELRRLSVDFYQANITSGDIVLPIERGRSAWAQYSVLAKNKEHRAWLRESINYFDLKTRIYYPVATHLQPVMKGFGYGPGDYPVAEEVAERIFSLPIYPMATMEDQETISRILTQKRPIVKH